MSDPFTGWAIVELMGRRRIAGLVTADGPLLQATRLQVDIYDGDAAAPAATQFVGFPVYALTPCTEAQARKIGPDALRYSMPVAQWELAGPHLPAIEAPDDDLVYVAIHAAGCQDPGCDGECDG